MNKANVDNVKVLLCNFEGDKMLGKAGFLKKIFITIIILV